jgi:putative peptidoglycan lipid II flippase
MSETSLARTSAVMAAGTVVSRLLGFVRASTLAAVLGIGLVADIFDTANTLPTQFYLLLAGGVLNAVLVPQITKARTMEDGGEEFVNRLLTVSFALIAGATVVVTALAPWLVRLY